MLKTIILLGFTFLLFFANCNDRSGNLKQRLPQAASPQNTTLKGSLNPSYNIYIENSGSMNGYVSVETDFKNAVLGLITDLKSKGITDTVNIAYINKNICPQKANALPQDIRYFFKNLNPSSFKNSNCGTNTSFMPEIIEKTITTKPNDVNVLISDFIFSDSVGTSSTYLTAAQNTVELYLSGELKKRDLSTIIVKLNSQFEGVYYVESKRPLNIDLSGKSIRRPYYIMIFGKPEKLQTFLSKIVFSDYQGFENSYYLLPPEDEKIDAKILRNDRIGTFEIAQPASQLIINKARSSNTNVNPNTFQFSIALNLQPLHIDSSFLLNPGNYQLPKNYQLRSISVIDNNTDPGLNGYTHVVTVGTSNLQQIQQVEIKFKPMLPKWVSESSNVNDSAPTDSVQQHQTFGFSYLVKGFEAAYANQYLGRELFSVSIKVSKDNYNSFGSRSNAPWIWIFILVLAVSIFIWLKNKK